MDDRVSDIRRDYVKAQLRLEDLDPDPVAQFKQWLDAAIGTGMPDNPAPMPTGRKKTTCRNSYTATPW